MLVLIRCHISKFLDKKFRKSVSFLLFQRSFTILPKQCVYCHCETKPFRWHIWMQNPAQNEVSDMNFQICLESVLIHSKWSKLVPEHPPGPKKRFLTTKHPQNNFNKFFQNSKFAAQNEFLAFSSKQVLKTRFGAQV